MTTRVIQRTPDLGIKIKLQRQPESAPPCAPARVLDSEGTELANLGCGEEYTVPPCTPAQVLDATGTVLAELGCGETYTCPGGGGAGGCPCEASLVWMRALPFQARNGELAYLEYMQGGQAIDWRNDAPVTGALTNGALFGDWSTYELWVGVIGANPAADIVWEYTWDGEEYAAYVWAHADVLSPNGGQSTGVSGPTAQVVHGYQPGTLTVTASVDGVELAALVLQINIV